MESMRRYVDSNFKFDKPLDFIFLNLHCHHFIKWRLANRNAYIFKLRYLHGWDIQHFDLILSHCTTQPFKEHICQADIFRLALSQSVVTAWYFSSSVVLYVPNLDGPTLMSFTRDTVSPMLTAGFLTKYIVPALTGC